MLTRMPVFAALVGIVALLMLIPSAQAANSHDWLEARGFLYCSIFSLFVSASLGVLLRPLPARDMARRELATLLLAWLLLPCFAALPLILLTPDIGPLGAWFEMVAALTTTGGSTYPHPSVVPPAIHLWRGLVGWFGGFLALMAAYVVLAPRRLGGFEVMSAATGTFVEGRAVDLRLPGAPFVSRLHRALRAILPVYLAVTVVLGLSFDALGERSMVAAVHAMSIVSTSGISPVEGGLAASESFAVEIVAAVFLVLVATRLFYAGASQSGPRVYWRTDPEIRLMAALIAVSTLALFLRHWLGFSPTGRTGVLGGIEAIWGAAFTSLSFLTTTGFHSTAWDNARDWSGHANPGMILLALCSIGGGAATTAGGIKLIRAHAMLRHGMREIERIAKPHRVAGAGLGSRGLRREGAMIAWAFMMLFALAFVVTVLLLTMTGMPLAEGLIAATAALSNTGPAYTLIAQDGRGFAVLGAPQHVILAAAMLLGRIETLAAIVLLHPESWSGFARAKRTGKNAPESPLSRW